MIRLVLDLEGRDVERVIKIVLDEGVGVDS